MFGAANGHALVTLASHGFVISVPPVAVRTVAKAQQTLLDQVRVNVATQQQQQQAAADKARAEKADWATRYGVKLFSGASNTLGNSSAMAANKPGGGASAATAGAAAGTGAGAGPGAAGAGACAEHAGGLDWDLVSKTCRHCKTVLAADHRG